MSGVIRVKNKVQVCGNAIYWRFRSTGHSHWCGDEYSAPLKKSKTLFFKYWNHHVEDVEPADSSAFEYINVDYAVRNCKWSKFCSMVACIAASVMAEDVHHNLGLTRKSIKRARQKAQIDQQPHQDGYWRKQVQLANNVTLHNTLLKVIWIITLALPWTWMQMVHVLHRPAHSRDQIKFCGKKHTEKKFWSHGI